MMQYNGEPLVIGVAGGTGSGKTTVANHIVQNIGLERVVQLQHDSYYKDLSHLSPDERSRINYDHPDSLDNDLLYQHLKELIAGNNIMMPSYDFKIFNRLSQATLVEPRPVIVIDGILLFSEERIRNLMGLKIFVDTDADLRFIRRLRRDVAERGRSVESVIEQYLTTVRLMHQEFIEPTKRYADLIIPEGGFNVPLLLDRLVTLVHSLSSGNRVQLDRRELFAEANGS
jgi:uridine kinase